MTLIENARNVLALKQQAPTKGNEFNTRHAHQGMRSNPNTKVNSLIRPMERGRQRAAAQVAQAKRDAR